MEGQTLFWSTSTSHKRLLWFMLSGTAFGTYQIC